MDISVSYRCTIFGCTFRRGTVDTVVLSANRSCHFCRSSVRIKTVTSNFLFKNKNTTADILITLYFLLDVAGDLCFGCDSCGITFYFVQ